MRKDWSERVEAIARDHTSGAAEMTRRASLLLVESVSDPQTGWEDLFSLARGLVKAQPEMASLFNLANRVLWTVGDAEGFANRRDEVLRLARWEAERDPLPEFADRLAPLVERHRRLVTISDSSTLRGALLLLRQRGIEFELTCAEGRPMFEGRNLARSLAEAGIPVRLVSDAAICAELVPSSLVLVGADAIRQETFTNKVGTGALALAARELGIPLYVVAERSKFLPQSVGRRPRKEDPGEIWPDAPPGVEVVNYYFEETPLELVTGVVTETGILSGGEAGKAAASVEVFPGLWSTEP